jgi:four helix bundle protein
MPIKSYKDLRVWQAAMDLVDATYTVTAAFPRDEIFGLSSQMRRAAVAVPSNIAEGHTREGTKEYLQFLAIARASLAELETQVLISQRRKYGDAEKILALLASIENLGRQLSALRNALRMQAGG